jgi:hypothetical protein
MPGPSQAPAFFHYVDRQGQDHIVDRLEEVPQEYRAKMLKVGAQPVPVESTPVPRQVRRDLVQDPPFDAWHAPSFVLGAASVVVVLVVSQLVRGLAVRMVVKTVVMGLVVMALGVGWITVMQNQVRQGAGLPPSLSPTQTIEDAKRAREELNHQSKAMDKAMQQLDP